VRRVCVGTMCANIRGTSGKALPSRMRQSSGLTAAAHTRTSTSCGRHCGTGRLSSTCEYWEGTSFLDSEETF